MGREIPAAAFRLSPGFHLLLLSARH
eukprot:SAG25_NODE_11925_length_292_cov_0.626943_1_plen_25_part_10